MGLTNWSEIGVDVGTATSTANAATINKQCGLITTEALTTAAGATYTMTVTNAAVNASSIVLCTVGKGTCTAGMPAVAFVTAAAGSVVIILQNIHSANALNGTIKIGFMVMNATEVPSA